MKTKLIVLLSVIFVLSNFAGWAAIDPIENMSINRLLVLTVDATINPAVSNYLETEIKRADTMPGTLLIVKINTPGGLVSTTKDILAAIGRAQRPVVVWVTPEGASATSAGAIIASGAHALLMNQGTNIGAATPVGLGEDLKESDGRSKAVNDLTALVKSLAQTRGKNADAFVEMIAQASSFSAAEAKQKNVIDGIATSLDQIRSVLADKLVILQGKKYLLKFAAVVEVEERPMDAGQRLLNILAHPTTAYILFIIGALLLYFEFQAPGGYVAGAVGVLCLITAGIAFQVLPLNFGAIGLLASGIFLLVLEVFVTSYGLLAIAGLVCLTAGSLFLYRHEDGWMTIQYPVIFSALASVVVFGGFMAWFMARENAKNTHRSFFNLTATQGQIMTVLGQEGTHWLYQIKVGGEIWKARAIEKLAEGDAVTVQSQSNENLILTITKTP